MHYNLAHLSDEVLVHDLAALVDQDRSTTANLLAHIAEVDTRRLYAPAGYSSMFAYCVEELRLSEDAAYKRIRAARAARQFPELFAAVAEGRLHLAAISLIAGHLTRENAKELIEAATHRKRDEIETWLSERFPVPDAPAIVRALAAPRQLAPGPAHQLGSGLSFDSGGGDLGAPRTEMAVASVRVGHDPLAPGPVERAPIDPAPAAESRFLIQLSVSKVTHDRLCHAQALLSHVVRRGDVAAVLDRALIALIEQLEKKKLGGGSDRENHPAIPRNPRRAGPRSRYIPAPVRRAVWERDHGQCTFVSANGKRCAARQFLEFDHVEPVARGGKATVEGLRLRCRAHNQYEAERAFGADFMSRKRMEARMVAAKRRAARLAAEHTRARSEAQEQSRDVQAGLRSLGCKADEARRAAESTEALQGATLEERMRAALEFLGSRSKRNPVLNRAPGRAPEDRARAPIATG
jgi:hypothetical protein